LGSRSPPITANHRRPPITADHRITAEHCLPITTSYHQSPPITADHRHSEIKIKIKLTSKLCSQKGNDGGDDASNNDNDDDWSKLLLLLDIRCGSQNNSFWVADHCRSLSITTVQR